jgi:hypothetical protein
MKTFFESKNYTSIMFLAILVTSIILLFTFVNLVQDIDNGITAHAIAQQNIGSSQPPPRIPANLTKESLEGEIYTTQAWSIFYIVLIVIITIVAFLAITLKKTIQKNIKSEETKPEGMV